MSVGIMSASQGQYTTSQLLLDITQGARIATSAYAQATPAALTLRAAGAGGRIEGWAAARRRAGGAPQLLSPGLLASSVAGGAGYVGVAGTGAPDAAAAADRAGNLAAVSLGSPATMLARIESLAAGRRLLVVDLPGGAGGVADLRALAAERRPGRLMIVVQRAPEQSSSALLWSAAAGLPGGGGRELSSPSTGERGLISAVDLAPSILAHLTARALPAEMRGRPVEAGGQLRSASLRALMARLRVISGRRLKALGFLLLGWALLALLLARRPAARAGAIRAGAIGVLWAPVAVLIPAGLEPAAAVEYAIITVSCLALGALTVRLLAWPRAAIAPALVAVLVLAGDALAHTQLLMRSLLGPDPILGARFYGIGNELKSGLAVLVLAAVAGALYPAVRGRRAAASMIAAGVVLAIVEGSARIGAGVGGVILVSGGFALATVLLLPGAQTRRRTLLVLITPLVALVALAALDLASAHGGGHFTGSVLHARSAGDLRDVIVRRYKAAWGELRNHMMPLATALSLLCAAAGLRHRDRLLAPVDGDPAWLAALCGGLAAGVIGALVEDSGPVLLVVAVFTLGCVTSYLWAAPPLRARTPGKPRGSRSRARRPTAAPVR